MKNIIEVKKLSKQFISHKKMPGLGGSIKGLFSREKVIKKAVDDISFTIDEGEIVGFLGPNGAGKTTTLKMLVGILFPSGGEALVDGFTPWDRKDEFKKKVGIVLGQKNQLLWDLPAEDSFELFKTIFDIPEKEYRKHLDELVDLLDVRRLLNIQVRNLSLGERMKMEIIAALLHKPKVLFLDEPTIGLDVVSQKNIRDFFKKYNKISKTTILLTSHYMQDIKELCKRVIIIDKGQLIYDDLLSNLLKEKINSKIIKITFAKTPEKNLAGYGEVIKSDNNFAELLVEHAKAVEVTERILHDFSVEDINIADPEAEAVIREVFSSRN